MPVGSPNTERAYGSFTCLFLYADKQVYAHDIFILIFITNPLRFCAFGGKDEDNILPQSADSGEFFFIVGPQGFLSIQLRIAFVHSIPEHRNRWFRIDSRRLCRCVPKYG